MTKSTPRPRRACDISTPLGRWRAWLHFYLKDHHLLRIWWKNVHEITGGVWRSNQPCPTRLAHFKTLGIKTVVTLRGAIPRSYNLFETEACAVLGMEMRIVTGLTARNLQPAEKILSVIDQLAAAPRPVVFHCKSGADRTGFAAALFLVLVEGRPVREAAKQLDRKYIHFERSKSGVLGHVFRVYLRDVEQTGQSFRAWLETDYDPAKITADFEDWRKERGRWAA